MSAQMSTATMSAPSSASRSACARPCPRAAPVMKATLPCMRPAMDVAPLARDVLGCLRAVAVAWEAVTATRSGAGAGGGDAGGHRARRQPACTGREGRRDALPALVDALAGIALEAGEADDVVGHPLEDLREHLLGHALAEVRAGAAVHPDAEGQVPVGPAVDVDLVGVAALRRVAVGRPPPQP